MNIRLKIMLCGSGLASLFVGCASPSPRPQFDYGRAPSLSDACAPGDPAARPCALPFDVAPEPERGPPPLDLSVETVFVPQVAIYVDEEGAVRRTQILRSTRGGTDVDEAAIERAGRMRFSPARLDDRRVGVWISMPIPAEAGPPSCPSLAVPVSAGGILVDSTQYSEPELGTSYRYESPHFTTGDAYLYSGSGTPLEEQAAGFIAIMDGYVRQGTFESVELLGAGPNRVPASRYDEDAGHLEGYQVGMRIRVDGEEMETLFAVFPYRGKFIKFRVTYPPEGESRVGVLLFMQQFLSAMERLPPDCPF